MILRPPAAALATRPAIGLAYHVPERFTPEWYAFGLLDQMLAQGRDSRFYRELVQKRALTGGVDAGINFGLGNQFDYQGPMLWEVQAFHDVDKKGDDLLAGFDRLLRRVQQDLRAGAGAPAPIRPLTCSAAGCTADTA